MENEKYLFVVSGAAGTGKDSVVKALREAHPEIEKTVSATTRSPRPGEQEGVDYYYRTREQFQKLIEDDEVVEHNFYNGNYYGTLKEEVNKRLNAGKLVVLVIDVHGAANIRRMYPGATTVFLLPPSEEELERVFQKRLEGEPLTQEELAAFRQRHIGFVFQAYNLLPNLTATENVALPLMFRGMPQEQREAIARKMLCRAGLAHRLDHFPDVRRSAAAGRHRPCLHHPSRHRLCR